MKEPPVVVNKYKEPSDVHVGRGSKFGNPYPLFREELREDVISKFKRYLWKELNKPCGKITKADILSLSGKRLGCFCKPKSCHGDVIVSAFKYLCSKEK